jgi:hypothetical protein
MMTGYPAIKEITRDRFGDLIGAIERGEIEVAIVRDTAARAQMR